MKISKLAELVTHFQKHTGCKIAVAEEVTKKYILHTTAEILKQLDKLQDGTNFFINRSRLQNTLGTKMVKGTRYYVLNIMEQAPERIFFDVEVGSNLTEKITMIRLNYDLEELLIATGDNAELIKLLFAKYSNEIENNNVDWIPIDLDSLNAYIHANKNSTDRKTFPEKSIKKFNQYLYEALRIKLIAEHFGGLMPNILATTNFARKYYQGTNLQNTSKIVRHAALGQCYEYDMESSVFAWKYSWYKNYCHNMGYNFLMFPGTEDILRKKAAIRKMLARAVFDTDDDWAVVLIKRAITAIGFGAPLRVSGYPVSNGLYEQTALNTIITSKVRLQKFISHPWIQMFNTEQEVMNEFIMESVQTNGEDQFLKTIPELVNAGGKLKKNSVISYKYQSAERDLLEWLISFCVDSEIILTVHDCIYTKYPINLRDVRFGLMDIGDYYKISESTHKKYSYDYGLDEHTQRIQAEERAAKGYMGTWSDGGRTKTPNIKEREQIDLYTGEHNDFYDGSGYDGSHYNPEFDPMFDDMSDEEISEYRVARNRVTKDNGLPEWYKAMN
jgi:hypothetical protein